MPKSRSSNTDRQVDEMTLEQEFDVLLERAKKLKSKIHQRNERGKLHYKETKTMVSACWINESGEQECGYKIITNTL